MARAAEFRRRGCDHGFHGAKENGKSHEDPGNKKESWNQNGFFHNQGFYNDQEFFHNPHYSIFGLLDRKWIREFPSTVPPAFIIGVCELQPHIFLASFKGGAIR
jgi:hypothetical protein